MPLIFESNIDTESSYTVGIQADGPNVYIKAYAANGVSADTPAVAQWGGSGWAATAISGATSGVGFACVPKGANALASGCIGWVQIRGKVTDTQSAWATGYTGSVGHVVVMGATATAGGLYATSGANAGNPATGEVGVLLEAASGSLTSTIYLTGVYATVQDLG